MVKDIYGVSLYFLCLRILVMCMAFANYLTCIYGACSITVLSDSIARSYLGMTNLNRA
jgi:hypothetical protein